MSTAAEVLMRQQEGLKTLERWRAAITAPLHAAMAELVEISLGAPRRRRWDQFGAYHRRQLKKWRKRNTPYRVVIS